MGKEYQFTVEKCGGCGLKLSGKHAELAGMKGSIPMGYCPNCHSPYRLVEVEDEPEPVTEPETEPGTEPKTEPGAEPVTEPGAEPVTEPGAEPVTEPGAEPVTAPEPEPESKPSRSRSRSEH